MSSARDASVLAPPQKPGRNLSVKGSPADGFVFLYIRPTTGSILMVADDRTFALDIVCA